MFPVLDTASAASDPAVSLLVVCFTGVKKDLHDDRTSVDSEYRWAPRADPCRIHGFGQLTEKERFCGRPPRRLAAPPPPPCRPAALPPLAARLAAEPPSPNVGPSGHAQKNRFFASRSRAGHLDSASRPFADRKPLSGESQHVGFSRLGRRGCPLSQFQDWNWFPSPQGRSGAIKMRSDPLAEHGSSPLPSLCRRG